MLEAGELCLPERNEDRSNWSWLIFTVPVLSSDFCCPNKLRITPQMNTKHMYRRIPSPRLPFTQLITSSTFDLTVATHASLGDDSEAANSI